MHIDVGILASWVGAFMTIGGAAAIVVRQINRLLKRLNNLEMWIDRQKTGIERNKENLEKQEKIRDGLMCTVHFLLYQECREKIKQGWCSVEDRKNIEYLYRGYHDLGGNGTGTELYERCQRLPLEEESVDNEDN